MFLRLASSRNKEGILKLAPNGIEGQSPEDTAISEMSKFEAEESEKRCQPSNWCQSGVISKNQLNKTLFFKENFPQLTFLKHFRIISKTIRL